LTEILAGESEQRWFDECLKAQARDSK
jgi:hypothetical protein